MKLMASGFVFITHTHTHGPLGCSTHHSIDVSGTNELLQNPEVVRRHWHHVVVQSGRMSAAEETRTSPLFCFALIKCTTCFPGLHFWNRYELRLHVAALVWALHVHRLCSCQPESTRHTLNFKNISMTVCTNLHECHSCVSYSLAVWGSTSQTPCLWGCRDRGSGAGSPGCFRRPSPCRCG